MEKQYCRCLRSEKPITRRAWPRSLHSYRAHLHTTRALETTTDSDRKAEQEKALLSKEQQAALTRIKRYTDFNDQATQSRLGRAGVERQVRATVKKAFAEAQQKEQQRRQQTQQQRRTRPAAHIQEEQNHAHNTTHRTRTKKSALGPDTGMAANV